MRRSIRYSFQGAALLVTLTLLAPGGARAAGSSPAAVAHYARGLAAKAAGDLETARTEFLAALAEDSHSASVLVELLAIESQAGHDSALVAEAHRYPAAEGPDRIGVLLLLAGAEARLGHAERAERAIAAAVGAAPDSVPLRVLLGQSRMERGDTTGALAAYRDAAERAPTDARVWHVLGAALASAESLDAARVAFTRSLALEPSAVEPRLARALAAQSGGHLEEALADYTLLAVAAPNDASLIARRSECLAGLGRVDEAAKELARLTRITGSRAVAERRLTILYWRADRPKDASRHAQTLAQLAPGDPLPHEVLGYLALDRRKLGDAEREFRAALARDSSALDLHFALGVVLTRDHRPGEAVPHLRRATEGDRAAGALYFLGLALAAAGDTAAAADTLSEAWRRDPRNGAPAYVLGQIAHARGDVDQAAKWMQAVLAADSSNASAWNYIGYLQADTGRNLPQALAQIRRALALEPENGAFLDSYGWVLFKLGRVDEARATLERAARKEPRESEILEHLGDVYSSLGRTRDARRAYERALGIGPKRPGVAAKLSALTAGRKPQHEAGSADDGNRR